MQVPSTTIQLGGFQFERDEIEAAPTQTGFSALAQEIIKSKPAETKKRTRDESESEEKPMRAVKRQKKDSFLEKVELAAWKAPKNDPKNSTFLSLGNIIEGSRRRKPVEVVEEKEDEMDIAEMENEEDVLLEEIDLTEFNALVLEAKSLLDIQDSEPEVMQFMQTQLVARRKVQEKEEAYFAGLFAHTYSDIDYKKLRTSDLIYNPYS